MNEFQLQIRGYKEGENVERIRPVFIWNAPQECRQFTLEMARDPKFQTVIFLRDTHECYYAYDSEILLPDTVHFARVRSGTGSYSNWSFRTEK